MQKNVRNFVRLYAKTFLKVISSKTRYFFITKSSVSKTYTFIHEKKLAFFVHMSVKGGGIKGIPSVTLF